MKKKYIFDNNFFIDIVTKRDTFKNCFLSIFKILLEDDCLYIASNQLHNIEYIIKVHYNDSLEIYHKFIRKFKILTDSNEINLNDKLALLDIEDYVIESVAKKNDCLIISNDGPFNDHSKYTITPKQALNQIIEMKNSKKAHNKGDICVIGLGYIGLPTAALLANRGYQVHGVDINQNTIDTINRGEIHIVEVGLDAFVHSAVKSGHLKADTKPNLADVFIIAVPTPFHPHEETEIPEPNIDYVISATKAIAPYVQEGNIVILESTSPVGTTDKVAEVLKETRSELFSDDNSAFDIRHSKLFISHCPERVLPGRIMVELVENDRIIGGIDDASTNATVAFYKTFVEGELLKTDAKTAEMTKLTENSFRDVNIAFANELSMICDKSGINVRELIRLANHHPRVNILQPGTGVGGHCIAVDPWFIVSQDKENSKIIKVAREINNYKTDWVIEKIINMALEWKLNNSKIPTVALMGLAFKPNIDDLREAPAVKVAESLLKNNNMNLLLVEPNLEFSDKFDLVSIEVAQQEADIIVYLVSHDEFLKMSNSNSNKKVLDFCGVIK
ncbi:MAG: UDP-N-acetyl-D-mannosamine dehydrogenase [Bacteroidota bacterium]|nr:UDP-N-acetyl-D-mannosamine dehydrogenase [Bacteroidota bacterium]